MLDLCGALFLVGMVLGAGVGILCSDYGYANEKKTKRN